jgi:predicted GH43/DUF377 family glycosyl hydrolase
MDTDTSFCPSAVSVRRLPLLIKPSRERVLIRPFFPGDRERQRAIADRVLSLNHETADRILNEVRRHFSERHFDIHQVFERHYERVKDLVPPGRELSKEQRLLLGAYFTSEYALESAALFNPSIVPHPDQRGLPSGSLRFIMSLRAVGEGHISSIEFRGGVINKNGSLRLDSPSQFVTEPRLLPDPEYHRELFARKLLEIGDKTPVTDEVLGKLPGRFSRRDLLHALDEFRRRRDGVLNQEELFTLNEIQWLAESNYDIEFSKDQPLSERVIFPFSRNESSGIEDARFVRFRDDDGEIIYYATYTAYNGKAILPQILETKDFIYFQMRTLNGPAVQNKGMALFPRKINGLYAMVGRQDNQNLFIMFSAYPHFWGDAEKKSSPRPTPGNSSRSAIAGLRSKPKKGGCFSLTVSDR